MAGIVSNLPFGRAVAVGGKAGDGIKGGAAADEYTPLLAALLPQAPRHAFVSGAGMRSTHATTIKPFNSFYFHLFFL